MNILLFFIIFSLFIPLCSNSQQTANGYNPYRIADNHKKEKLYFKPYSPTCYGRVETENGNTILADSLYWLYGDCKIPEIGLNKVFILLGKDDSTMMDHTMKFQYNLYAFDRYGNFLCHVYTGSDIVDYWENGTVRYVKNGKMGILDTHGEIILPALKYTYIEPKVGGLFYACKNCDTIRWGMDETLHGATTKGNPLYDIYNKKGKKIRTNILLKQTEKVKDD